MEIDDDEMDLVLSALSHGTRRSVIGALASSGAMTFSEMMQATGSKETGTFGFHFKKLLPLLEKEQDGRYKLSRLGSIAVSVLDGLERKALEFAGVHEPQADTRPEEPSDQVTYIKNLKVAWINRERLQRAKGVVVSQCINVLIDQDVNEENARDKILSFSQVRRIDVPKHLRHIILSRVEREIGEIVPYEGKVSINDYTDRVVKELEEVCELEFYTEGVLSAKHLHKPTKIGNYERLKIMDDVTPELVQSNVLEIENYGVIWAPRGLKEALLSKMTENYGWIEEL